MPAPKRTPFQREHDMALTAKWYAQNRPVALIARDIGVTVAQVRYDIETVKKRWMEDQRSAFDERVMMQIAKLDMAEREAWEAWEASKEEKVTTTTEKVEGDKSTTKAQLRKEKRNGDIAYYNAAMDAIKERSKLWGLYAPDRVESDIRVQHTGVIVHADVELMTAQERADEIQKLLSISSALQTVGKPLTIDGSFSNQPSLDDHPALAYEASALPDG